MNRLCALPIPLVLWSVLATSALWADGLEQEQRIDRGLDWGPCTRAGLSEPVPPLIEPGATGVSYMDADSAEYDHVQRIVRLNQAAVRQDDTYLEAGKVIYHQASRVTELEQAIYLEQPGLRLTSDQGQMDLDDNTGWFSDVEYRLPEGQARGSAERMDILSTTQSEYRQVMFTTCPPGSRDWSLRAKKIEIDQENGWGNARHAVLRLGKLPILYSPYFSFPIDDRRKTGFLFPTWGSSKDLGTEFSIPYYLNLAPDYDATLTPRWMSRRGVMLGGEIRFLGERQNGTLSGETLNDKVQSDLHDSRRSAIRVTHRSNPLQGLNTRINYVEVSDMQYLDDFSSGIDNSSTRYLERIAQADYRTGNWSFTSQVQDFQTVDATLLPAEYPYSLMPRLAANYRLLSDFLHSDLGLNGEYTYFSHDTLVTGQRVRFNPILGLQLFRRPWGYLSPRLTLNVANYQLEETDSNPHTTPSYSVPTLSLDSGLVFERDSGWFGNAATQTLEPRLHYLYAPYEDQSDIPDFDTSELEVNFANLFKDNRFIGGDRVGDANQIALGITTRWLENDTGLERLRASIGQSFYFQDRQVQLDGLPPEQRTASPVVAELSSQLGSKWRTSLNLRWDPELDEKQIDKGRIGLHYRDPKQRLFNISYNYDTTNNIEDLDLSFYWRFNYRFTMLGAWKHSLLYSRDLNRVAGFEYGGRCCWRLRAVYQEYVNETDLDQNIDQAADVRFMLQLELRGLGALGQDVGQTLRESIYGYQSEQ